MFERVSSSFCLYDLHSQTVYLLLSTRMRVCVLVCEYIYVFVYKTLLSLTVSVRMP